MLELLSFTALIAFTATIDVQAAISNHGQCRRTYANQNNHQDRVNHTGVVMSMHTMIGMVCILMTTRIWESK